jgi:hypothetical protein
MSFSAACLALNLSNEVFSRGLKTRSPGPKVRGWHSSGGAKTTGDPGFLHIAPNRSTCAVPAGRERMKFANAKSPHTKAGEAPP